MSGPESPTDLHPIEASVLHARRERVFLVLAGAFLGTLTMLNILGTTRFIDLSFSIHGVQVPFVMAVGVLPYPLTFLCTDFISEFYGRARANFLVIVGAGLNVWLVIVLWVGGALPGSEGPVFDTIKRATTGLVIASMLAYLTAQFCDVYLFHFWKRLTKGRHLWLRNNGSTLVSQAVDTVAVIIITYLVAPPDLALPVDESQPVAPQLWTFIYSGYVFKLVAALIDTIPFYIGSKYLARYLEIDPTQEH